VFDAARRDEARDGPDWEKRDRLGWWPGFWGTTKGVLFDPVKTFDRARLRGFGPAFSYALLCNYVGIGAAMIWQVPIQLLPMLGSRGGGPEPFIVVAILLGMVLFMPAIATGMQFVSAAFTHLGLMILKGANESYETTYRAVAYGAAAPTLLAIVPICGGYVGNIWGIVTSVIALSKMHRIEWWRALIALFLVPAALALILGAIVLVVIFAAVGLS
jgi:hypothetical protein